MAKKYIVYKDNEVIVPASLSPLEITGVEPNTNVPKGTYQVVRIVGEKESERVDIPAFKTGQITPDIYSIGGNYITGKYEGISPTKIALIVNDEKQKAVNLSEELITKKQFRYYKQGIKASDRVKVVLYDESIELGSSDVVIQSVYSMSMTANKMKTILDEKNIDYKTSDTKETLLSLLQKNE
ncbi:hypothetical protein NGC25_14605 [Enterococcus faecalis]|uniref:immunoglobulin-like domain-containing protein n=1 Tax=Enterococcus faecalis TaxID=1351 RepID=UPI0013870B79|nr:immunoglobulin-like domain-containing protein [Enterococcus faecalis]MEB7428489.1 hypothetical protein [Enterococcus faecalis]